MQEFSSKVDLWLAGLMLVTVLISLSIPVYLIFTQNLSVHTLLVVSLCIIPGVILPLWLLFSTKYIVSEEILFIRSGPFSWSIPIDEIVSVVPTRNALSSPALSLDRIRIDYSGGSSVLISPKNRERFLNAIGKSIEL